MAYEKSLELADWMGDRTGAAIRAANLGRAYTEVPNLRDLGQAEHWFRCSLELTNERDGLQHGKLLGQLGSVAFARFKEARERKRPKDELLGHLNEAVRFYHQALEQFPADAVDVLAVAHNVLGAIYRSAGNTDRAVAHFRDSITTYQEKQGNVHGASLTRFNVALALAGAGRPQDALEYARAALRGFESYGKSAADEIQRTRQLIERIEQNL